MITVIEGEPGTGKVTLMSAFVKHDVTCGKIVYGNIPFAFQWKGIEDINWKKAEDVVIALDVVPFGIHKDFFVFISQAETKRSNVYIAIKEFESLDKRIRAACNYRIKCNRILNNVLSYSFIEIPYDRETDWRNERIDLTRFFGLLNAGGDMEPKKVIDFPTVFSDVLGIVRKKK